MDCATTRKYSYIRTVLILHLTYTSIDIDEKETTIKKNNIKHLIFDLLINILKRRVLILKAFSLLLLMLGIYIYIIIIVLY